MPVDYSKQQLTVLQINMMLHYYAIAAPYAERHPEHARSHVMMMQRSALVSSNMLKADPESPSGFKPTDRGVAYVKRLTHTPLPEQTVSWGYDD